MAVALAHVVVEDSATRFPECGRGALPGKYHHRRYRGAPIRRRRLSESRGTEVDAPMNAFSRIRAGSEGVELFAHIDCTWRRRATRRGSRGGRELSPVGKGAFAGQH